MATRTLEKNAAEINRGGIAVALLLLPFFSRSPIFYPPSRCSRTLVVGETDRRRRSLPKKIGKGVGMWSRESRLLLSLGSVKRKEENSSLKTLRRERENRALLFSVDSLSLSFSLFLSFKHIMPPTRGDALLSLAESSPSRAAEELRGRIRASTSSSSSSSTPLSAICSQLLRLACERLKTAAVAGSGPPLSAGWAELGAAAADGLEFASTTMTSTSTSSSPPSPSPRGHAVETARYSLARALSVAGMRLEAAEQASRLLDGAQRRWCSGDAGAVAAGRLEEGVGVSSSASTSTAVLPVPSREATRDQATLVVGAALTLAAAGGCCTEKNVELAAAAACEMEPWLQVLSRGSDDDGTAAAARHRETLRRSLLRAAASLASSNPSLAALVAGRGVLLAAVKGAPSSAALLATAAARDLAAAAALPPNRSLVASAAAFCALELLGNSRRNLDDDVVLLSVLCETLLPRRGAGAGGLGTEAAARAVAAAVASGDAGALARLAGIDDQALPFTPLAPWPLASVVVAALSSSSAGFGEGEGPSSKQLEAAAARLSEIASASSSSDFSAVPTALRCLGLLRRCLCGSGSSKPVARPPATAAAVALVLEAASPLLALMISSDSLPSPSTAYGALSCLVAAAQLQEAAAGGCCGTVELLFAPVWRLCGEEEEGEEREEGGGGGDASCTSSSSSWSLHRLSPSEIAAGLEKSCLLAAAAPEVAEGTAKRKTTKATTKSTKAKRNTNPLPVAAPLIKPEELRWASAALAGVGTRLLLSSSESARQSAVSALSAARSAAAAAVRANGGKDEASSSSSSLLAALATRSAALAEALDGERAAAVALSGLAAAERAAIGPLSPSSSSIIQRRSAEARGRCAAAAASAGFALVPTSEADAAAVFDVVAGLAAASPAVAAAAAAAVVRACSSSSGMVRAAALLACARFPSSSASSSFSASALAAAAAESLSSSSVPEIASSLLDAAVAHASAALLLAGEAVEERRTKLAKKESDEEDEVLLSSSTARPGDRVGEAAAAAAQRLAERHAGCSGAEAAAKAVAAVRSEIEIGREREALSPPPLFLGHARAAIRLFEKAKEEFGSGSPFMGLYDAALVVSELAAMLSLSCCGGGGGESNITEGELESVRAAAVRLAAAAAAYEDEDGGCTSSSSAAARLRSSVKNPPACFAAAFAAEEASGSSSAVASAPAAAAAAAAAVAAKQKGDAPAAASLLLVASAFARRQGDAAEALAAAGDALRLSAAELSPLMMATTTRRNEDGAAGGGTKERSFSFPAPGWWSAVSRYLCALHATALCCESAGAADDALAALHEERALLELAAVGGRGGGCENSSPFVALAAAAASRVRASRREWADADADALEAAGSVSMMTSSSPVARLARAEAALASGGAALARGARVAAAGAAGVARRCVEASGGDASSPFCWSLEDALLRAKLLEIEAAAEREEEDETIVEGRMVEAATSLAEDAAGKGKTPHRVVEARALLLACRILERKNGNALLLPSAGGIRLLGESGGESGGGGGNDALLVPLLLRAADAAAGTPAVAAEAASALSRAAAAASSSSHCSPSVIAALHFLAMGAPLACRALAAAEREKGRSTGSSSPSATDAGSLLRPMPLFLESTSSSSPPPWSKANPFLALESSSLTERLDSWLAQLPRGTAVISLAPCAGGRALRIVRATRGGRRQAPPSPSSSSVVVVAVEVGLPAPRSSSSGSSHEDAVSDALGELAAIQRGSHESMRKFSSSSSSASEENSSLASSSSSSSASAQQWWSERVSLDSRLAALLTRLDSGWLGPWSCLLLGKGEGEEGEDEVGSKAAGAAEAAATKFVAAVCSSPSSTFAELARLLAVSAPELSDAELRSGFAALLLESGGGGAAGKKKRSDDSAVAAVVAAVRAAWSSPEKGKEKRAPSSSSAAAAAVPIAPRKLFSVAGEDSSEEASSASAAAAAATPKLKRLAAPPPRRRGGLLSAMKDESGRPAGPAGFPPPPLKRAPAAPVLSSEAALAARVQGLSLEEGGGTSSAASRGCSRLRRRSLLPVVLVLDEALQPLPWEATPRLRGGATYRCPSLAVAAAVSSAAAAAGRGCVASDGRFSSSSPLPPQLDASVGSFLVNPGGDLAGTQAALEPLLASRAPAWKGRSGSKSGSGGGDDDDGFSLEQLEASFSKPGVFFYAGHGGGEPYLPRPPPPPRPSTRCGAVLMGCSSGALRQGGGRGGKEEASAFAFSSSSSAAPAPLDGGTLRWLASGCPSAVATLWDVTDRDIDRFAAALLGEWLLVEEEKEKKRGESGGATGTSNAVAGGDGAATELTTRCVAASVARARRACRLPSLIGAAPVVYGVPTAVKVATRGSGKGGGEERSSLARTKGEEENSNPLKKGGVTSSTRGVSSSSGTPRPAPPRVRASANGRAAVA